jgi:hypothetical protein
MSEIVHFKNSVSIYQTVFAKVYTKLFYDHFFPKSTFEIILQFLLVSKAVPLVKRLYIRDEDCGSTDKRKCNVGKL